MHSSMVLLNLENYKVNYDNLSKNCTAVVINMLLTII